jgi:MFS family permease
VETPKPEQPAAPVAPGAEETPEVDPESPADSLASAEAAYAEAALAESTQAESAAPEAPPSRWGVLRHHHFRNVWLAAFTSSVGGWMEIIGMQWVMTLLTTTDEWIDAGKPSATLMMAYLGAAQLGPTLLLGLIGGLVADRVNRKRLLLVTQMILMVIAVFLAVASYYDRLSPTLLILFSIGNGVTMAFNVPAWQVLTPRLVPREELTRAITLNGIQFNLARVIGPGLGGVLMGIYGPTVLFIVNALSFVGILIAIATTPDSPAPRHDGAGPWAQIKEAAAFMFHRRGPFRVFVALVLFSMLAAPLMRMLPLLVKQVYHAQEQTFGTLLSVMGLGAVIGGLSMKLIPAWYPKHHLIPLSITLAGLSITAVAAANTALLAGLALFFCGAFWLWAFNSSISALQLLVDDRMRGRVMALSNTAVFGAMPVGSLLAGWLAEGISGRADDAFGTQVAVGALAVVLTISGIVMLIWRTPEVDGIAPGQPGFDRRPGLIAGILAGAHRPAPESAGAGSRPRRR